MCVFRAPQVKAMAPPPAIAPRIDKDAGDLPTKKDLVTDKDTSDISYGSSKKQGGAAAAKKTGTAALKIPLNTGAGNASQSGGLNV